MSKSMLNEAKQICFNAIASCLPEEGVRKALKDLHIEKQVVLVAVGKASFTMAKAALKEVKVKKGIVISKYGHIQGSLDKIECYEAGHPVLDENGIKASKRVLEMCKDLSKEDVVLFLLSGGASALFEYPLLSLDQLQDLNTQMLKSGMNIQQINTVRKKLSKVKGGRFADLCKPAKLYSIILSDVLSDRLDMIGSGPSAKDLTKNYEALKLLEDYQINISEETRKIIENAPTAKADNAENIIIGSVKLLCAEAMKQAAKLDYRPILLDDQIDIEAKKAGDLLFEEIQKYRKEKENICLIMGGETVVHVKGNGLGGRNQELVFSQLLHLRGMENVLMMSVGSDGTDGPTDAAGGFIDGSSYDKFVKAGGDFEAVLNDNDSYHGLKMIDALIMTGPTGTNVNDLSIALISNR